MGDSSDLVPPAPVVTPAPSARTTTDHLRCQFCESSLTAKGEVLKLSDRAKALRDFEDDNEDLRAELALAKQEIEDKQKMIDDRDSDMRKLQEQLRKAKNFW